MKIPRRLSGRDLVRALCRNWDYRVVHQEGSHLVLETDVSISYFSAACHLPRCFPSHLTNEKPQT
jgi:hypothetical protein